MAKASGNTRNYNGNVKVMAARRSEFDSLMALPEYDRSRSLFDKSGGFVATHKGHDKVSDHNVDKSDVAVAVLAKKGYKVYLDNEKSTIEYRSKNDGRIYTAKMDVKTINEAGANTIKTVMEKASKQGATTVILYQNTKSMTRSYVENQIQLFKDKSPQQARKKINRVIVVGLSGRVHVHHI